MEYGYARPAPVPSGRRTTLNDVLVRIDPVTGKVVASIPVGSAPAGVAVTEGSVWVADEHNGTVQRIDPATNKVVATIPVGPIAPTGPQIMTAGPGGVWVGIQHTGRERADRCRDEQGRPAGTVGRPGGERRQAGLDRRRCQDRTGCRQAIRIDPDTGKVITTVDLDTQGICGLAVGLGSVWVATGGLTRIDEATGRIVGRLDLNGDCGNVIVAGGAVWVTADGQPYVDRISPQ